MSNFIIIGQDSGFQEYLSHYIPATKLVSQMKNLLELGDNPTRKISTIVNNSYAILLVLNTDWQTQDWVINSNSADAIGLKAAFDTHKSIILILSENVTPPFRHQLPEVFSDVETKPFIELNNNLLAKSSPDLINRIQRLAGLPEIALNLAAISSVSSIQVSSAAQTNDIFISYSRRNIDFVQRLHHMLVTESFRIWVDWEDILPTTQWLEEIYAGIESAHTFIFVVSVDSLSSTICQLELEHAVRFNHRIIPVIFQNPDMLSLQEKAAKSYLDIALDKLRNTKLSHFELTALSGKDLVKMAAENYFNHIKSTNWVFFEHAYQFEENLESLKSALQVDLPTLQLFNRLYNRAREWKTSKHNDSYLLRGAALLEARQWVEPLKQDQAKIPEVFAKRYRNEFQYIEELVSVSTYARQRRLFGMVAATLTVITIIIAALYITYTQIQAREREGDIAASLLLVGRANTAFERSERLTALSLAAEAAMLDNPPSEVKRTLSQIAYQPGIRKIYHDAYQMTNAAYSQDGAYLYTFGDYITEWDAKSGLPLRRFSAQFTAAYGIEVHPNGQQLVVLTNNAFEIWNIDSGTLDRRIGGLDLSFNFAITSDGTTLLTNDSDENLLFIDFESGNLLYTQDGHTGDIVDIKVTENNLIYTLGTDQRLVAWDSMTGEKQRVYMLPYEAGQVFIDNSDQTIAYLGGETHFFVLDLITEQILQDIDPIIGTNKFAINTIAETILALSPLDEGGIYTWDLLSESNSFFSELENVHEIIAAPQPFHFLVITRNNEAQLWDLSDPGRIQSTQLDGGAVTAITINDDETLVAAAVESGRIDIWDIATNRVVNVLVGHNDLVKKIAINTQMDRVAAISDSGDVIIWELSTGRYLKLLATDSDFPIEILEFSPDARQLLIVERFGKNKLWDIETGQSLGRLDELDITEAAWLETFFNIIVLDSLDLRAYHIRGNNLIFGNDTLIWWNLETHQREQTSSALPDDVQSVALSPNSQDAIVLLQNGMLLVIEFENGEIIQEFDISHPNLTSSAIGKDGTIYITGHADGTIQLRRIEAGFETLQQWIYANRYIIPLECSELEAYNAPRQCGEPLALAQMPQATLPPPPTATALPPNFTPTVTQHPTEAATIPPGTAIAQEIEIAEVSFFATVPEIPNFVPSWNFWESSEGADEIEKALLYPSENYLEIYYDHAQSESLAFVLHQSESPYINLEEWQSEVGIAAYIPEYGQLDGLEYGYTLQGDSQLFFFIYANTFVSVLGGVEDISFEELLALARSYIGDGTFLVKTSELTDSNISNVIAEPEIVEGATRADLNFEPLVAELEGYRLQIENIVSYEDSATPIISMIFGSNEFYYRAIYSETGAVDESPKVILIESQTDYNSIEEWFEKAGTIIRDFSTLVTIHEGLDVVVIAGGESGEFYLLIVNNHFIMLSDIAQNRPGFFRFIENLVGN